EGEEDQAATLLAETIAHGGEVETMAGMVSLVGAGPGAPDLLTLRAVQRLQEADIIYYDNLVDDRILELARRDAERIYVGKRPGAHAWPQDRINGVIVAAAQKGQRVVRLKSGDPLVFGRAAEEASALDAAGIDWEVVPGVTSALAAAAEARFFPTERGVAQSLVLATGMGANGAVPEDIASLCPPGTTAALYMARRSLPLICDQLRAAGLPDDAPTVTVEAATQKESLVERQSFADLRESAGACARRNPAIIFVQNPAHSADAPDIEIETVPEITDAKIVKLAVA
ncbi:MAG: uroporphyrinogen-III C-methyltransferase, partial [Pseudomonadota bacterium]